MSTIIGLAVDRMTTRALRGAAFNLLHELGHLQGISIAQRDRMLHQVEDIVDELAARAEQGKLF